MAVLVLAFLGFGVLIGRAARNSVQQAALADAAAPLKVVVAPRVASPAVTAQAPATRRSAAGRRSPDPRTVPVPVPGPTSAPAAAAPTATTPAAKPKSAPAKEPATLPAIKHVFLIVLSDQPYAAVFGPESKAKYLVAQLEPKGTILSRYDAIAHEELPNEVALVSGQGPTLQTAADCPSYAPIEPANLGPDGQVLGEGCVYPASVADAPGRARTAPSTLAGVSGRGRRRADPVPACSHPAARADRPHDAPRRCLGRRRERPAPTRPTATRSPTSSR